MKTLNIKATEIFKTIISKMNDEGYCKIDNTEGAYMPLCVEQIGIINSYVQISLAHYYEQNGDLMADPEMIFLYNVETGIVIPYYYKQDGFGLEQTSIRIEGQEITGLYPRMQKDHTTFANMWLRNIKEQQDL